MCRVAWAGSMATTVLESPEASGLYITSIYRGLWKSRLYAYVCVKVVVGPRGDIQVDSVCRQVGHLFLQKVYEI